MYNNSKKEELEGVLKKYGQEHLLNGYDKLADGKKSELLDQILTLDFAQIERLYGTVNTTYAIKPFKSKTYDVKKDTWTHISVTFIFE